MPQARLLRIGELSRRSGVPVGTIKHYIRERLIVPVKKTGATMSWYDPRTVDRLQAIKELQRRQFLPLDVIRSSLARTADSPDDIAAAEAIARVLARRGGRRAASRSELVSRGSDPRELDWLAAAGLAVPSGKDRRYRGDDLALLSTLGAARRAGLTPEMLPFHILDAYLAAIRALVSVELRMFREGVFPRADGDVAQLTKAATVLSERLVVLLRRKLLLPTLHKLIAEESAAARPAQPRSRALPGRRARPASRRARS